MSAFKTVLAVMAVALCGSALATTYYVVSPAPAQNTFVSADNFVDADGNHPAVAPNNSSFPSTDDIVVKDGLFTRDASSGTAAVRVYAKRVTYGELDGTKGTLKLNYQNGATTGHTYGNDGVYFVNGELYLVGIWNKNGGICGTRITVQSPTNNPFRVTHEYRDYTAYFQAPIYGESNVGLRFVAKDKLNCNIVFNSDMTNYRGSLDVGSFHSIRFAQNVAALDFQDLSFGSSVTVTVASASIPLKAKRMRIAGGDVFNMVSTSAGEDVTVSAIQCETLERTGEGRILLHVANTGALESRRSTTVKVPLVTATAGGLSADDFEVDLGSLSEMPEYRGLSVDAGEGVSESLVATFVFEADESYHLTAAASAADPAGGCLDTVGIWEDANGANPPHAITSPDSADTDFTVDQGRVFRVGLYGVGAGKTFYGKSLMIGRVARTAGTLRLDSQRAENHNVFKVPLTFANGALRFAGGYGDRICQFTATATVTAPLSAPFALTTIEEAGAANMDTRCHLTLIGDTNACVRTGNKNPWKPTFDADLSAYKGVFDFSNGKLALTFGMNTGVIDLKAFSLGADSTVSLKNVTAPLKAETMTIADGVLFDLSSVLNGGTLSVASLETADLVLGGSVRFRIPNLSRVPYSVDAIPLLKLTGGGTLDISRFSAEVGGAYAKYYRGLRVDSSDGASTLVATFDHPGIVLIVR